MTLSTPVPRFEEHSPIWKSVARRLSLSVLSWFWFRLPLSLLQTRMSLCIISQLCRTICGLRQSAHSANPAFRCRTLQHLLRLCADRFSPFFVRGSDVRPRQNDDGTDDFVR